MKRTLILGVAATVAAGMTLSAAAHHSFAAEFDRAMPITVTGTVTKVEWANPHARFYIDAKDESGKTVNWDFELASPLATSTSTTGRPSGSSARDTRRSGMSASTSAGSCPPSSARPNSAALGCRAGGT